MKRDEALELLKSHVKNDRMLAHCYAAEAVMRALARKLGRDEEKWGLGGLLHDLDVETCNADLTLHTLATEKVLKEKGVDPDVIDAIVMHNEVNRDRKRSAEFEHALAAGETITGLIIATTLVYPDRKIAGVKPKSVVKRMKEKQFAASVNRDIIMECEKIGLPLDAFVELSLNAMREISDELGL